MFDSFVLYNLPQGLSAEHTEPSAIRFLIGEMIFCSLPYRLEDI